MDVSRVESEEQKRGEGKREKDGMRCWGGVGVFFTFSSGSSCASSPLSSPLLPFLSFSSRGKGPAGRYSTFIPSRVDGLWDGSSARQSTNLPRLLCCSDEGTIREMLSG